jgi:hypothetical protein
MGSAQACCSLCPAARRTHGTTRRNRQGRRGGWLSWPNTRTRRRRPWNSACARARERWPQIASLQVRHRGVFSYTEATLTDATALKLCRLRYVGSAHHWQFAIYRASHDDYDESVFFTGLPIGTCQDALDTACGLYLNDPTAWA